MSKQDICIFIIGFIFMVMLFESGRENTILKVAGIGRPNRSLAKTIEMILNK